jgi:hypothetical protein
MSWARASLGAKASDDLAPDPEQVCPFTSTHTPVMSPFLNTCMKTPKLVIAGTSALLASTLLAFGEIQIVVDHNANEDATASFKFKNVPSPLRGDAAAKARFTIVDGEPDGNGGNPDRLHDGALPNNEDEPVANLFFKAGTVGGRILVDLGTVIDIKQINSYSWHAGSRGPQVYQLYGSEGKASNLNLQPKRGTDPAECGWTLIAKVNTLPKNGDVGGQYGVSISDSQGTVGQYQHLLFDMARTEAADSFGNTFYSEIDVIDRSAPAVAEATPATQPAAETVRTDDGIYQFILDTTETPDLTEWAHQVLAPVLKKWYPILVQMLPSEGYEAPKKFSVVFSKDMRGVAATSGTRIRCAANWYRQNLKGEAVGSVVHEMVHVVQQYGRGRRNNPSAVPAPGWLTEGITDYIRFYKFEPETHGAEITRRNLSRAKYDASYRITANFLNWTIEKYDHDLLLQLNTAIREGKYNEELWKARTGHTVQELGEEWKTALEKKLAE